MLKGNHTRIAQELITSFLKVVTVSDNFSVFYCLLLAIVSASHLKEHCELLCVMNEKIHNAVFSFSSQNECTFFCPLTQSVRKISDMGNSFRQEK